MSCSAGRTSAKNTDWAPDCGEDAPHEGEKWHLALSFFCSAASQGVLLKKCLAKKIGRLPCFSMFYSLKV